MTRSSLRSSALRLRAALAGSVLLLAACASGSKDGLDQDAIVLDVERIALEDELQRSVPEELMPAFEALLKSVEDGDDEVARGALNRLYARGLVGRALELAQAFERILDGRELTGLLDFRLRAEMQPGSAQLYRLVLVAGHRSDEPLQLRSSGARLRQLLVIVDPDGREQRSSSRQAVAWPGEFVVPVGEELRIELADLQLTAPAGLLALSSQLQLEILPGEYIDAEGRYLPAQGIPIDELELVRLAQVLPTSTVEPSEVARYVSEGRIYVPALMERVVRVAPERRDEALDALEPLMEDMSLVELELLVPGLRWLARTTRPGGDPEAWRTWMKARAARAPAGPDWGSIELPGS